MQAANHLAGLWIVDYDIVGEDLGKMFGLASIERCYEALNQRSVVDRHLLDETLERRSSFMVVDSSNIPRCRFSSSPACFGVNA
jgi:hypothetical protein